MKNQLKNILSVVIVAMLFTACAPVKSVTAPVELLPEPVVVVSEYPANAPAEVPADEVDSEKFSRFIGLNTPPLPAGLSEGFGLIINDSNDYALSMVLNGESKMLWLEKLTGRDENGAAYWIVVDVLGLPKLDNNAILIPDGCSLNGTPDSEIIVAARNGSILMAWRANTTLDRFEAISTAGIRCDSDKSVSLS